MKVRLAILCLLFVAQTLHAQPGEAVGPLGYRYIPKPEPTTHTNKRAAAKPTALTLPFFEDFASSAYMPDTNKWMDRKVYINNTMCIDPVSQGAATFDGIDENGLPYEKVNKTQVRYADSLTSKTIDLTGYTEADSLYLSFFYQPQGNGFDPQSGDSLMLYFRRTNTTNIWTRVWRVEGSTYKPFQQVMVPLNQAYFFHADFQFRFVNKASMDNTDDTWNVDYIRLGANRNINDTLIDDVAMTAPPGFVLNDFTYMPYHQFLANANNERAATHGSAIKNIGTTAANVNYNYTAREVNSGTFLGSGNNSMSLPGGAEQKFDFPAYTVTPPDPGQNQHVLFENKYYLQNAGTGAVENDTITRQQIFHNFMAYDDGSAEKSYYLKQFPTLPGKLAVEYRMNVPDTLKGIAIYFGRQVPLAYGKYFSVAVYKDIAFAGGTDQLLYQEDFLQPSYLQQDNFWYYKFAKPVILPAGKFYIGTVQPALSSSDSLYIGLDENRQGDNHIYFSVTNEWRKSKFSGAVMIRPLFGLFFPSIVNDVTSGIKVGITPNPATDKINISYNSDKPAMYTITDASGRTLRYGSISNHQYIDIKELSSGVYIIQLMLEGRQLAPQKIIKL